MRQISFAFKWLDLDNEQRKDLFIGLRESIPLAAPSFKRVNELFNRIDCEFLVYIERGIPKLRLSDDTRETLGCLLN
jgi:hypothetical protein